MYCFTKTGEWHKSNGIENQDFVYSTENDVAVFFAVADGVSAGRKSRVGAQIACEVSAEIILDHVSYYFDSAAEKVKAVLLSNIRNAISIRAKEDGCEPEDYASTLSFVCFNKQTDQVLSFSLGDSRIYRIDGDRVVQISRTAELGRNTVCSTVSYRAEKEAAVDIDALDENRLYLLCTDGMWRTAETCLLFDSPGMIRRGEKLAEFFDRRQINDDCSFLLTA